MRFPGFEGEWEEYINENLFSISKEKNKSLEYHTVLSASQTEGMVERDSLGIDIKYEAESVSGYKVVRPGEYVIHLRSFQGGFAFSDTTGICSPAYTILHPKEVLSYGFLREYFMSRKFIDSLRLVTYGIRDGKSISIEEWMKLKTYIPKSLKEQERIKEFFGLIDKRLTIQNKVIEDFKMLKATLSRKLLWDNPLLSKRVQLSNFGTLKNGYAFKSSEYIPESEFRIVTIANVTGEREISINNCNTIHSLPRDIQEHQKLKPNDILVSLTGNVGRVSLCNLEGCLLNQRVGLFVLNDDYLHEYIFQVLSDIRFLQSMINSGQGAAQMNIGKYDVESFFIPFSEDLNLLNKIARMLYSIDLRITQSMKDLLLLRKQKHYFLSNLFI